MDWCRKAVIPVGIDMRSFILAEDTNRNLVNVKSYPPFTEHDRFELRSFNPKEGGDLRYVRAVFKAMIDRGYRVPGSIVRFIKAYEASKLTGETDLVDLPVRRGLSSSAAVSVATAGALYVLANGFGKELHEISFLMQMADIAYTAERKILGINCGEMDQYASALGNVLYIDCSAEPARPTFLRPKIDLPLVIGDTKQMKDTPMILAWLGKRFMEKEELFMQGIVEIVKVVEEAKIELSKEHPSIEKIGELMNLNQYYLKNYLKVSGDCPMSPNKLDELIEASIKAGALGAKLSGSGGGGAMVALCKHDEITNVAEAIRKAGGDTFVTAVAKEGLKLKVLD